MKTNALFQLFVAVACMMCAGCTGKRKAQSDVALVKETPPAVQSPEVTDDTLAVEEPDTETSTDNLPRPVAMVLEPVARDIPVGRPLSADSLSMRTEYDYYPVATSKVKVFITNRANQKYDSGERYSLVYYNEALKQWEPQPTNPIINDVLWVFTPDYPTHRQTIQFYTDKNRPGRYRIYKSFNRNTRTAYAEFELVSKAQHQKLLDKINWYGEKHPKDRVIENLNTWGFQDNDTLYMSCMVNSEALQKEFPAEGAELCGNRGERWKRGCGYLFHPTDVYGYFRHQDVHGESGVSAEYRIRSGENREPERTEYLNGVAVPGTSERR